MINYSEIIADQLANNRESLKQSYTSTNSITNTKYFILDNVLPADVVAQLYESFPSSDKYHHIETFREKKYTFAKLDSLESNLPSLITDAFQLTSL